MMDISQSILQNGSSCCRDSPNAEIDKVGIHQDMVGRPELFVVSKEQGSVGLFDLSGLVFLLFLCQFLCFLLVQVFSHTGVVR